MGQQLELEFMSNLSQVHFTVGPGVPWICSLHPIFLQEKKHKIFNTSLDFGGK